MVRKRHCCSIGYSLSLGAPIGVGGPRVLPVRAHSSYATELRIVTYCILVNMIIFNSCFDPGYLYPIRKTSFIIHINMKLVFRISEDGSEIVSYTVQLLLRYSIASL